MFSLLTSRLYLRDFQDKDIKAYVVLYQNEQYTRFYPTIDCRIEFQTELAKSFIERSKETPRKDYSLAINNRLVKDFVGTVSMRLDEDNAASIGCGIALKHQYKGYAQEAMQAMIDFAFCEIKVQRIIASTINENNAAVSLCMRLGFNALPNSIEKRVIRGQQFTSVQYELVQD